MVQAALDASLTSSGPFSAAVTRQLSLWPFAARTLRLYLLVDPSIADESLRSGLSRAMEQAYFRSDACSQTRAVREAALAAHYVLRHYNRDALPTRRVNAASAVAAVRDDVAFVALAGQAAAFAWCDGALTGQRGILRLPRPLGLEPDPPITLWSARLQSGDRLALVCGARWTPDSSSVVADALGCAETAEDAQVRLANALGGTAPAGVLVIDPKAPVWRVRPSHAARRRRSAASVAAAAGRLVSPLAALALLCAAVIAALNPVSRSPLAQSADDPAPAMLALEPLAQPETVAAVSPAMAVRLGPSSANVVDLAVGSDALYTLDVVERTIRGFALDAVDQVPTPDTLLVRAGAPLGSAPRRLSEPVAIQYVGNGARGSLVVVDQSRAVIQMVPDHGLTPRSVPSSAGWRELGALGSDSAGRLYVLDSRAGQLLQYPPFEQRVLDPPRLLLDTTSAPDLPFERVAEVVGLGNTTFLRLDDGSLRRLDADGSLTELVVRPADGRRTVAAGIAADRTGGLFVADARNARVLDIAPDGSVLRQFGDAALGGVRAIQTSLDGRRMYGLVAAGVLVFDLPD